MEVRRARGGQGDARFARAEAAVRKGARGHSVTGKAGIRFGGVEAARGGSLDGKRGVEGGLAVTVRRSTEAGGAESWGREFVAWIWGRKFRIGIHGLRRGEF